MTPLVYAILVQPVYMYICSLYIKNIHEVMKVYTFLTSGGAVSDFDIDGACARLKDAFSLKNKQNIHYYCMIDAGFVIKQVSI